MQNEIVHFSQDDIQTLCGQSASPHINCVCDYRPENFCPDCIRFLRNKEVADNLEFQWSDGAVCFDCPCGEEEIIISEGEEMAHCECGRVYKLVHYVALIQPPNMEA